MPRGGRSARARSRPTCCPAARGELAGREVHDVRVPEVRAKAVGGLHVAGPVQDAVPRVPWVVEQQVRGSEPAPVGEQVPHGELARRIRIVHLESREVLRGRVVPLHLTLIHQHGHQCGREGLAGGADREQGVLVHRVRLPQRPHPVAARQHDRVAVDDGHRETGYAPGGLAPSHVRVEALQWPRLGRHGAPAAEQRGERQAHRSHFVSESGRVPGSRAHPPRSTRPALAPV